MSIFRSEHLPHRIKPAELAHVEDAALAGLEGAESRKLQARMKLEQRRAGAARARADLQRVAARRRAARAEVASAKAERLVAEAYSDLPGVNEAGATIATAHDAKDALHLLIRWKRAELDAADAWTGEATAEVWKARADLELQRASLVLSRDHGDFQHFVGQLDRLVGEHKRAHLMAAERTAVAERQKRVWETAAAQPSAG